MFHTRTTAQGNGFTLIEILVTLVIVVILFTIIVSVINNAKGSAQRAQCVSNLRALVAATHLYANEHNGQFPTVPDSSRGIFDGASQGLVTALSPYTGGGGKIFYCPDQKGNYAYENQQSRSDGRIPYWNIGYYYLSSSGGPFARPNPLPQTMEGRSDRILATCLDFNGTRAHGQQLNLAHADGHISTAPRGKRVWDVVDFTTLNPR